MIDPERSGASDRGFSNQSLYFLDHQIHFNKTSLFISIFILSSSLCILGRLELREDTIESLLSASCLLQLSSVVQACCSFLMKQLHPSNCLGIRSYADAQGCHDLQRAAHAYTMVGTPFATVKLLP